MSSMRSAMDLYHERAVVREMEQYHSPGSFLAAGLCYSLPVETLPILIRIDDEAAGGVIGLESRQLAERAALAGILWWVLRRADSLAVISCPTPPDEVRMLTWLGDFMHRCPPKIKTHLTYDCGKSRLRVCGRAGWGIVLELAGRARHGHNSKHLCTLHLGAGPLSAALDVPARDDALRIYTFEPSGPLQ